MRLDGRAALNILAVHLRPAATTNIGADRRPCYCAASSRYIPAASAADLVAQHAANHCSGDRSRYVGGIVTIFDDLLSLDPAALLGRTDHCAHRTDGHFV